MSPGTSSRGEQPISNTHWYLIVNVSVAAIWISLVSLSGLQLLPGSTLLSGGAFVEDAEKPSLASIIPLLLIASWPIVLRKIDDVSSGERLGLYTVISRLAFYSGTLSSALLSYSLASQIANITLHTGDAAALGLAFLAIHFILASLRIPVLTPCLASIVPLLLTLVTMAVAAAMLSTGLHGLIPLALSIYAAMASTPQVLSLTLGRLRLKQDLERSPV